MPRRAALLLALMVTTVVAGDRAETPSGEAKRGAQLFRACAACHSLAPDRNMTGPSLAGIWGRKAGSLESFERYSPALKAAAITWHEKTLYQFIQNPGADVHGTKMVVSVPGNDDRQNVIAYLKTLKP